MPAILAVFKAEEWDNFGLATVNSSLIYSIIDVLLGGRRGQSTVRVEGRPYTTIETNLVKRMIEVVLADAELAFKPLSPVKFNIDRLETNPRFAAISRPANAAILVRLRIDMEDRGGNIELLLPYATIEPIRAVLLQMFMGEKFGRDPIWEGHLATEIGQARIGVDAVLYEARLPLRRDDGSQCRRHADARTQAGRDGDRALRRHHADRRPHGPRRRPRRRSRRKTAAQTADHVRHVRKGRRDNTIPIGGTVSYHYGFLVETMVSILLLLTILYCVRLNKQLRLLKADEQSLRATISELVTATEIADRAIGGLKSTMQRGRASLERAAGSRRTCSPPNSIVILPRAIELLARLVRIAGVSRPAGEPPRAPRCQGGSGCGAGLRRSHARIRVGGQAA